MMDIEKIYMNLYNNCDLLYEPKFEETLIKKDDFAINLFKIINNTKDIKDKIKDLEDGYGYPLITLILNNYDIEVVYSIKKYYKNKKDILEMLFDVSKNSQHPIDEIQRKYGTGKVFEFIDYVYDRDFSLIHMVEDYTNPRSIYEFCMSDIEGREKLDKYIGVYKVLQKELDLDYTKCKYCNDMKYDHQIYGIWYKDNECVCLRCIKNKDVKSKHMVKCIICKEFIDIPEGMIDYDYTDYKCGICY